MSYLTSCNYCSLNRIKKRYNVVELRLSNDPLNSSVRRVGGTVIGRMPWTDVFAGGNMADLHHIASFAAITDYCVCDD